MKVKDFIKELSALDPEAEVILQTDPEGNYYYFAGLDCDPAFYHELDGELRACRDSYTPEDCCLEDDEEAYNEYKKKNRCVVVYPG